MNDTAYQLGTLGQTLAYAGLAATIAMGDMPLDVAIDVALIHYPHYQGKNPAFARKSAERVIRGIHRALISGEIGTRAYRSEQHARYIATGRE